MIWPRGLASMWSRWLSSQEVGESCEQADPVTAERRWGCRVTSCCGGQGHVRLRRAGSRHVAAGRVTFESESDARARAVRVWPRDLCSGLHEPVAVLQFGDLALRDTEQALRPRGQQHDHLPELCGVRPGDPAVRQPRSRWLACWRAVLKPLRERRLPLSDRHQAVRHAD